MVLLRIVYKSIASGLTNSLNTKYLNLPLCDSYWNTGNRILLNT